jgi:hypothetical protein
VPILHERKTLIIQMHKNLAHFGGQRTLAKICKHYFKHAKMEDVKMVVKMC